MDLSGLVIIICLVVIVCGTMFILGRTKGRLEESIAAEPNRRRGLKAKQICKHISTLVNDDDLSDEVFRNFVRERLQS